MASRTVLRGAVVVDGGGGPAAHADLAIDGDRISEIGEVAASADDREFDCRGRALFPGFIDAHSHADGRLFDPQVQQALLRQGVTTVIGGQDGVSYAPGDGRYAAEYFAAINGSHPSYRGSTVADLLATYDSSTRLNFAYLVPAGTVRYEVMGRRAERATDDELRRMTELVADGIRDGALGLSTGLDYVPGLFADAEEIAALCAPLAAANAVHVSHMRGGYEANSAFGLDEIVRISQVSGVRAHLSHFHAPADTALALLSSPEIAGIGLTFDAYPYTRGCTLLAMPLLPPELAIKTVDDILQELSQPGVRDELRATWFPQVAEKPSLGPDWPGMITLGHIAAPEYDWAHGLTIAEASAQSGKDAIDFSLDVLVASRLEVNATMAVRYDRPVAELGRILSHSSHVGGSDGIFVGAHPHPRAYGSFARYLGEFATNSGVYSWPSAAVHLASRPADTFALPDRGRLRVGDFADIIVVDTDRVTDNATYESPIALATGIDDVFVAGEQVLAAGQLTAALPGRALRRAGGGR